MRLRPVISSLLIFILLALFAPDARAQTVLGKSPADKFAAAFWAQNTNADAVIYGLNGFGHGMLTNALLFPYVGGANITITPNPDGTISISGTGGGGGTPMGAGSNIVITVIGGSNYFGVVPRFTNSLQAAITQTNIANASQLFQEYFTFPNGASDAISFFPHAANYSGLWQAAGFSAGVVVPGYTGDGSALTGIPVTALSLAGAVNGNVPTVVGGVWGLATPSGSGLALTDTNAFANSLFRRSDTNAFAASFLRTADTNGFAGSFALKANNGTDFSDRRSTSSNLTAKLAPIGGTGNPFSNMRTNLPDFEGQLLINYYGGGQNVAPYLWSGGTTNRAGGGSATGDYLHGFNFPAGLNYIGDDSTNGVMDPANLGTTVALAYSPAGWDWTNRNQDIGLHLSSGNTFGSGTSLNFNTVITNGNGVPITIHTVDASLCFTSTNAPLSLLPGYFYNIMNIGANMKGFAIGSTVVPSGFQTGNYMSLLTDPLANKLWFPVWTDNTFMPSQAGWRGSYVNNATGDSLWLGNCTASNFISSGYLYLSDINIYHYGANGGDMAVSDSSGTLFFEASKNTGMNLRGAAGQLYSWNNSSQFSNVANGTVGLQTSSGTIGTLLANVTATNLTVAGSSLFGGAETNLSSLTVQGAFKPEGVTPSSFAYVDASTNLVAVPAGTALPVLNAGSLTNYTPDANSPNMVRTLWHDGLVANAATETAISTNNLPANTLSVNGQAIEYVLNGTNSAGSARTMAIYVFYGTGHDYVIQSTSTAAGAWEAHIRIVRVSASVVDVYTWGQIQGATSNINKYTDTGSTASAQPLSVTLQSTGGGAAGDISCRWGRAQFMP